MIEASNTLNALAEEFVEESLRLDPVAATDAGIHDYDHRLPDDTPAGFHERLRWAGDFEARLERSAGEATETAARVDAALLHSRLASRRAEWEVIRDQTRNPVRYPETALQGVFLLITRPFAPLEERKEAILSRLMAIPEYLDAARHNLDIVPGIFVDIALEVSRSAPAFVDEVTRTLLGSFPGEVERIEHAGARARRGFLRYQDFLDRELRSRARGSFAIGESGMNLKLAREHLLSMDCAALDAIGREQIAIARTRLDEEARRIDPAQSWREQVAAGKRRHPEPQRLRDAYRDEVERARRFITERRLMPVPEGRLEMIDTPVFERVVVPYAAYLPPSPFDGDQTGHFYVTPIDRSRPREEQLEQLQGHSLPGMTLIALHEAYPGHHLQQLHSNRVGSRLRRLCNSDVFAEGWALYCEELMHEEGFFTDPLTRLFQLKDLLWRACRVVIDVGLQTGRMSFEQAVAFLVEEAMLERVNAETEVKRYTLSPTQPMSYVVGKLAILEIREEARRRLGARFNLHDFHAALLAGGTLPPALVREEIWERLG